MSDNCLVTKLKGEVQNDNLPILGKAFLSVRAKQTFDAEFVSKSGQTHLKSKVPFTVYGQSEKRTEITVGTVPAFLIFSSEDMRNVQDSDIIDIIEIDNIYNCALCYMAENWSANKIVRGSVNAPITNKSNLTSLFKYAPLEIVSIAKEDVGVDLNDSVYYLILNSDKFSVTPRINIDKYMAMPNIEVIAGAAISDDGTVSDLLPATMETNGNYNNSKVIYLGLCFPGPITSLPFGIKFVDGTNMKGVVEDFVTAVRESGRTEGALVMSSSNYNIATFGGTRINKLIANEQIPLLNGTISNTICLTWDDNHPTGQFVDTAPEGNYVGIPLPSEYYINKHNNL